MRYFSTMDKKSVQLPKATERDLCNKMKCHYM